MAIRLVMMACMKGVQQNHLTWKACHSGMSVFDTIAAIDEQDMVSYRKKGHLYTESLPYKTNCHLRGVDPNNIDVQQQRSLMQSLHAKYKERRRTSNRILKDIKKNRPLTTHKRHIQKHFFCHNSFILF